MSEKQKPGGRVGSGTLVQPTPYYVQASCELSEDYFLTADVLMEPGDKVLPFVNTTSGAVEAIVVTGGQLAHLRRDPAVTSGWAWAVIDTPFPGVTDAAVLSSPAHNAMIMAVGQKAANNMLPACQLSLLDDGSWTVGSNGEVANNGPLGCGATASGDLYWYGWTQGFDTKTGNYEYTFWRWDGMGDRPGVGNGTVAMTLSFPVGTSAIPVAARLHLDADVGGATVGYAAVMIYDSESKQNGDVIQFYQLSGATPSQVGTTFGGAASLLWSYVSPGNTSGVPAVLWQDTDGNIYFLDEAGAQTALYNGGSAGDGQAAAWLLNGEYTFILLDDGVANVVSQFASFPAPGFTLPIPLAGGIERIYSVPADPAQGTLFAVDAGQALNVLTKDPAAGWTQTVVHRGNATWNEVTSWRTQISVLDANDVAVGGGQVRISADRPAGLWQPSSSTVLTPAAPATMTTDPAGKITVSIPASELDTARLTAQALDVNGNPTGSPFAITPNIDVQRFLAGQGSLTGIGKMDGPALLNAKNADGSALLPGLTDLAGSSAVAGAISHVANLGLGYQPAVAATCRLRPST